MSRVFVAALLGLATALPAAAQFQRPTDAIKYRQSVMQVQAFHFGRIAAMASGRVPFDAKVAEADAMVLDTVDKLPFVAFIDGTQSGGNTRAKPEIWSQRAKFDAAAMKMQEEVAKLTAAAKTGSLDQIKAATGGVGAACKACHDDFQSK